MTRVTTGLNDYRYAGSLHIEHPTVDPGMITDALRLAPERVCRKGEQRRTPNKRALTGVYDQNHWYAKLESPSDGDVTVFLTQLIQRLDGSKAFLKELSQTGGRVVVFVGLFADRCCDFELPAPLIAGLATTGLGLRLDFYGSAQSPSDSRGQGDGQQLNAAQTDCKQLMVSATLNRAIN